MQRICYLADASSIHTCRWVSYFAQHGYDVHLFSFLAGRVPGAQVHVLNAGLIRSEGGNWRYLLHLPTLRRQFGRLQPALVHAHYLTSYGLLGALCGYRPLVLTAWGSDVLVTPRRSTVYRLFLRLTLARADLVTSDAKIMSQEIQRYGLAPQRLLTIPIGVDLNLFHSEGRVLALSGTRLISTRQLLANTNLQVTLTALAHAQQRLPDLSLEVVGDGPERGNWQALAQELQVDGSVRWRGNLDHQLLPALLREADLYVALTLSDSTSVSLLEAMACGALPVVSDLPANREWITPGVNGFLVAPTDAQALAEAIVYAAGDPALRRRAAAHNAALIAERADWNRNMQQIDDWYRALIVEYTK